MMRTVCVVVALCCFTVQSNATEIQNTIPEYEVLSRQALFEFRNNHFAVAETLYLRALESLPPGNETERALILVNLGNAYANRDDLAKAEQAYLEACSIYKRLGDKNHTAVALRNVGAVFALKRRDDQALRFLEQALKLARANPPSVELTQQVLNSLGIAYYKQNKNGKAESYFNQALDIASKSGIPFDKGDLLNNLAAVQHARHNFRKAEVLFKEALALTEAATGPTHPDVARILGALAIVHTDTGRYTEAEAEFQRALRILQLDNLDFDTRIARILHGLSVAYAKSGRKGEAETALSEAVAIARRNLSHPDMVVIVEAYSGILKHQGKTKEAEELVLEARRARLTESLVIKALTP